MEARVGVSVGSFGCWRCGGLPHLPPEQVESWSTAQASFASGSPARTTPSRSSISIRYRLATPASGSMAVRRCFGRTTSAWARNPIRTCRWRWEAAGASNWSSAAPWSTTASRPIWRERRNYCCSKTACLDGASIFGRLYGSGRLVPLGSLAELTTPPLPTRPGYGPGGRDTLIGIDLDALFFGGVELMSILIVDDAITGDSQTFEIDAVANLSPGRINPIPEPASGLLVGLGLVALRAFRRR